MPLFALNASHVFPPVHLAEPDGLLAMGGDLASARLIKGYTQGIFPWYEGDTPLWWSPDPRFVLFPAELKVSKSMKALLRKEAFTFRVDSDFPAVIRSCRQAPRKGQEGTWISEAMLQAYTRLHREGYAHSAEAWVSNELAGGLYGVRLGRAFFGESMFSRVSNASKFAFIRYVEMLAADGVTIIDCQVYTSYLESLGARMIPRTEFISRISS